MTETEYKKSKVHWISTDLPSREEKPPSESIYNKLSGFEASCKFRPVVIKPWPVTQGGDGHLVDPDFSSSRGILFPYFDRDDYELSPSNLLNKQFSTSTCCSKSKSKSKDSGRILPVSSGYPDWDILDLVACPICTDPCIEAVLLGCGHSFCRGCVREWMKKKNWCPLCQTHIAYLTRDFALDRIVDYLADLLPPCTRESLRDGQIRRVNHLTRELLRKRTYPTSFQGRLCFWWDGFVEKLSAVQTTVENKGLLHLVQCRVSKVYQLIVDGEEYVQICNSSCWTVTRPLVLFTLGLLIGYIFNLVDFCSISTGIFHRFININSDAPTSAAEDGKDYSSSSPDAVTHADEKYYPQSSCTFRE